jgi:hypothetical protein
VHVARSSRGGPCASWHFWQAVCSATAWRPGSFFTAWQEMHGGGVSGKSGLCESPCGRWQVSHPPEINPCLLADSFLWHEEQVWIGGTVAPCASWQLRHAWWPFGAVARSRAWQEAHGGDCFV